MWTEDIAVNGKQKNYFSISFYNIFYFCNDISNISLFSYLWGFYKSFKASDEYILGVSKTI